MNYYNEFEPSAVAILHQLIADKLIPYGVVDDRSIEDVRPSDLAGFTQCHFFAGIGGWPLALDMAGVPRSTPLWTASCPCQPFSAAGEGAGFADERHLWPAYWHLASVCRPGLQLGEQVASKDAMQWIDLVRADMEAAGYACGAIDLPAAGAGAPHIRQRLIWVGYSDGWRLEARNNRDRANRQRTAAIGAADAGRDAGIVALAKHGRRSGWDTSGRGAGAALPPGALAGIVADSHGRGLGAHAGAGVQHAEHHAQPRSIVLGRLADSSSARSPACELSELRGTWRVDEGGAVEQRRGAQWAAAEWLTCSDGKARAVEPGIFPLASGVQGRVGILRGAGNAISPPIVAEFLEAFFESVTQ